MRRIGLGIIVTLMVLCAAGAGIKITGELSRFGKIEASIREQIGIEQEVAEGRKKLREDIERLEKEARATPDSLRSTVRMRTFSSSFDLAKAEAVLDQKELRAKKRLEHFEEQRSDSKHRIVRWSAALGIVEIVLGVCGVVLIRR